MEGGETRAWYYPISSGIIVIMHQEERLNHQNLKGGQMSPPIRPLSPHNSHATDFRYYRGVWTLPPLDVSINGFFCVWLVKYWLYIFITVFWRVCFLGFFLRLCGYIMVTEPENFICRVFQCSPNAATLTKALEEACQVTLATLPQYLTFFLLTFLYRLEKGPEKC